MPFRSIARRNWAESLMRSPQNATTAMIPIGSQKLTGRPKTPADIKNTKKNADRPAFGCRHTM
ncbi:MAG: hypothetical protein WCR46_22820 [Deltaproteobacteria bacterium]